MEVDEASGQVWVGGCSFILEINITTSQDLKTVFFQYDFGDPLIVKDAVYGLFAGADDLVPGEYPMVYTDVTKYLKWINEYIGG